MGFGFAITIRTPKSQEELDKMKSDLAAWYASRFPKQAAALSEANPTIDHLAEAIPHYHNYLKNVINPSNKDWLFAGEDPLIKIKD